jgi:hypothetical protein
MVLARLGNQAEAIADNMDLGESACYGKGKREEKQRRSTLCLGGRLLLLDGLESGDRFTSAR